MFLVIVFCVFISPAFTVRINIWKQRLKKKKLKINLLTIGFPPWKHVKNTRRINDRSFSNLFVKINHHFGFFVINSAYKFNMNEVLQNYEVE